jgi:hypothetical protein
MDILEKLQDILAVFRDKGKALIAVIIIVEGLVEKRKKDGFIRKSILRLFLMKLDPLERKSFSLLVAEMF